MREVLSFCFEQLTDPLALPLNPIEEIIILAVLNQLAYKLAFRTVRGMYNGGIISGSTEGSLSHWPLRFIFFVVLWGITNGIIIVSRFIVEHWLIILGTVLLSITIIWLIHHCVFKLRTEDQQ